MQIVTGAMMRELDRRAVEEAGVASSTLMENAGAAVAREALRILRTSGRRSAHVLCGPGNNGGDGLVAARLLRLAGVDVTMRLVGAPDRMAGDVAANLRLARAAGVVESAIPGADAILIDALLGTGASGPPRGTVEEAIRASHGHAGPVLAVDIPSGVDADTGTVADTAMRADVTVTFGLPKPGLLVHPGCQTVGELVIDSIGFPWDALRPEGVARWYTAREAQGTLRRRNRSAHKGHFGHVLVVGGSAAMPGAPSLASMGALRAGAGLVTVAVPDCIHTIVASRSLESMCMALPSQGGGLAPSPTDELEASLARFTVLCVGPGASLAPDAKAALKQVMSISTLPRVVDADGLAAFTELTSSVRDAAPTVLTPHPGECARMLGVSAEDIQADRFAAARETALRFGSTVVLKGAGTVIARPPVPQDTLPRMTLVTTGNPGMATGGSGDVLSGVIAALIAQGHEAYEAACLGAYLHGRAGDIAAAQMSEPAMCAGDIIRLLPEAIKEVAS